MVRQSRGAVTTIVMGGFGGPFRPRVILFNLHPSSDRERFFFIRLAVMFGLMFAHVLMGFFRHLLLGVFGYRVFLTRVVPHFLLVVRALTFVGCFGVG